MADSSEPRPPPPQERNAHQTHKRTPSHLARQLEGRDVMELTRFADKKDWIDDKIKFLASLPPVDALSPDPPARSQTTKEELKEWWLEHDRIELEVDRYDMGDLAKLKSFAKSATQHDLSPADTDLIEITLTTLFAVDKLLHLLRNRRKALTLLNYRLQWEASVATASAEHLAIVSNLPRFLTKSRWTIPPQSGSRSRHPSLDPALSSLTTSSSASLSSIHSASSMSRTMRSEVLSLELAGQKSKIHSLTKTSIPATAVRLDKLIDASPTPLPEAFLDAQDTLEDEAKKLTEGLGTFLADMVRQWRNSDEVFWVAWNVETKAEVLGRDVAEAQLKLPRRETADDFEAGVEEASRELRDAQRSLGERRRTEGFLPTPVHPTAPEQGAENRTLVATLEKNIRRAGVALQVAEERIKGYRFAAEAFQRSVALRREMDAALKNLRSFADDAERLQGWPNLDDLGCLLPSQEETQHAEEFSTLAEVVAPALASALALLQRASTVVVDLNKAGIDPNVRQAVKETVSGLSSARSRAQIVLADDEAARKRLSAARAWSAGLDFCVRGVDSTRSELLRELDEGRWREGRSPGRSPFDVNANLVDLRQQIDSVLETPLASATTLLPSRHPRLYSHLQSCTNSLRSSFDDLLRLRDLLARARAQEEATTSLLSTVSDIDTDLQTASNDADTATTKTSEAWKQSDLPATLVELQRRVDAIAARLAETTSAAHLRIPFIAPSPTHQNGARSTDTSDLPSTLAGLPLPSSPRPPAPLTFPFVLDEQDAVVRTAVNSSLASSSGRIDEVRQKLAVLEHLGLAFGWDEAHAAAHVSVVQAGEEITRRQSEFDERIGNDEDHLATLRTAALVSTAALETSRLLLDANSTALERLRVIPVSSSPLFNSHADRVERITTTTQRHLDAVASNEALLSSLAAAEEERKREVASDAAILARAKEVEAELEASTRDLEAFVASVAGLEGRPDLVDERCLRPSSLKSGFDGKFDSLAERAAAVVAKSPEVVERATAVVADLEKEGPDPAARKSVEDGVLALSKAREEVESVQASIADARRRLADARMLDAALVEVEPAVEGGLTSIEDEIRTGRWIRGEQSSRTGLDVVDLLARLRDQVDASLQAPLEAAFPLLPHHPKLHAHLLSRASKVASSFADLARLQATLADVRAQAAATTSALATIRNLDAQVLRAVQDSESFTLKAASEWLEADLASALAALETHTRARRELESTQESLVPDLGGPSLATVPDSILPSSLLGLPPSESATASSPPPLPIDFATQNVEVHEAVREALESVDGRIEELKKGIRALEHLGDTLEWDRSHGAALGELSSLEEKVGAQRAAMEGERTDSEGSLTYALEATAATSTALAQHREILDALDTSLSSLRASPSSLSPPFNSHLDRQSKYDDLASRHAAALEASAAIATAITLAQAELAKRLEEERISRLLEARRQADLAARRAEWVERRTAFDSRARAGQAAAAALLERTTAEANELDSWKKEAVLARANLLESADLSASSPDEAGLEKARLVVPDVAASLGELEALQVELAAVENVLENNLVGLESEETLASSVELGTSLCDGIAATKVQVERLTHMLASAEEQAKAWPSTRDQRLEERRISAEEAASRKAALEARRDEALRQLAATKSATNALTVGIEASSAGVKGIILKLDESPARPSLEDSPSAASHVAELQTLDSQAVAHGEIVATLEHQIDEYRTIVQALRDESTAAAATDSWNAADVAQSPLDSLAACDTALRGSADSLSTMRDLLSAASDAHQRYLDLQQQLHEEQDRVRVEWDGSCSALQARLASVAESLDGVEANIQRYSELLDTLPPSANGTTPGSHSNGHSSYSLAQSQSQSYLDSLEDALARLRDESSLTSSSAEVQRVRLLDVQLRSDVGDAPGVDLENGVPSICASLDERIATLRARATAVDSALVLAIGYRSPLSVSEAIPEDPELDVEELSFPEGLRRSAPKARMAFTSSSDVEDVFGPTLRSVPFPAQDEEVGEVAELRQQLVEVGVELWLDDRTVLQLPLVDDAQAIQRRLSMVFAQLQDLEGDSSSAEAAVDLEPLKALLESKIRGSDRIVALAEFHQRVATADAALSDLLTSIDVATGLELPPSSRPGTPGSSLSALPLAEAFLDATTAVTTARKDAVPLIDDTRVQSHLGRLEQTFAEMSAMIDDLSRPPSSVDSVSSSRSSRKIHQSSRPPSRHTASRESSRSGSFSVPTSWRASSAVPPSSQPSSSRPSSVRRPMMPPPMPDFVTPRKKSSGSSVTPDATPRGTGTPRVRVSSMAATVPQAFSFGSTSKASSLSKSTSGLELGKQDSFSKSTRRDSALFSSVRPESAARRTSSTSERRGSVASTTSNFSRSSLLETPTGERRVSSRESKQRPSPTFTYPSPLPRKKTVYKANPKRKVDVEVARIVNQLPVNVAIKPAENEYKIDSGMYWIGEAEPRLVFLRILRSQTAMVRIGGGWQELSAFLLTHHATTTKPTTGLTISPARLPTTMGSTEPSWISASSIKKGLSPPAASVTLSKSTSTLSLSVRSLPGTHHSPLRRGSDQGSVSPGSLITPRASKVWRP